MAPSVGSLPLDYIPYLLGFWVFHKKDGLLPPFPSSVDFLVLFCASSGLPASPHLSPPFPFVSTYNLLKAFRCSLTTHLMVVPPTGQIWCLCLIPDLFVDRVSFWLIKVDGVFSCHQFLRPVWWLSHSDYLWRLCPFPILSFGFHSVSIQATHWVTAQFGQTPYIYRKLVHISHVL